MPCSAGTPAEFGGIAGGPCLFGSRVFTLSCCVRKVLLGRMMPAWPLQMRSHALRGKLKFKGAAGLMLSYMGNAEEDWVAYTLQERTLILTFHV